jgi:uncharacterized protein with HEPN domain
MRAVRNVVMHAYSGVDHRIVWDMVRNDLPLLIDKIRLVFFQTRDAEPPPQDVPGNR